MTGIFATRMLCSNPIEMTETTPGATNEKLRKPRITSKSLPINKQ